MKLRIVAATRPEYQLDYIIEKKTLFGWKEATNCSYATIKDAEKECKRLLTKVYVDLNTTLCPLCQKEIKDGEQLMRREGEDVHYQCVLAQG